MDASIDEPFHVATYSVSQRLRKSKANKDKPPVANVFASHDKFEPGSSSGYITVTVQGDGVHILDFATLHPVISHTLGPSTNFSSASVSIFEAQENTCATYSGIASSADVAVEDCGRTLWMWRENLSSPGDRTSQKKKAAVMPHFISDIYSCAPQRLLLLSAAGDVTVVDADLNIRSTVSSPSTTAAVLQSFVFPKESISFYQMKPGGLAIVNFPFNQITSGYLSIMTKDGSWVSFQIESKNDGIRVYSAAQPLRLKSLSFIETSAEARLGSDISLIALNTSIVLLAGITSTRNIVLLLWDLQYSVLLASHMLAIPSTLSNLPKLTMTLSLTASASPQALLVLSPPAADAPNKSAERSSIFAVPLTVPKMSTISNAMGRAAAGTQWLDLPPADEALGSGPATVLASVRAAMANNDLEAAEKAFFTWEASERQAAESNNDGECQLALGHSFVRDILAVVLQPVAVYSSALVRFLLEKRVVSASMVDAGLLAALKQRGDWTPQNAIEMCTQTVIDLAESDLMLILQTVAEHSRAKGAADAMDVDALPPPLGTIPELPTFLNACVRYRTSPTALRVAIHQHLVQSEDVLAVLEVLDSWLSHWKGAEIIALPSKKSIYKDAHGVPVLKDGWQKTQDDGANPPLIKVLFFIQTLLDASLLALLQHTPAHAVLRRLLSRIELQIQVTEQVDPLRGALEVFARAQAKALREAKEGKKDGGDWRQRRRLVHERAAMAVGGVYQLEELVL
ncbi:hypothetical protein GGX14DRAFT_670888 [Mycena pura]|uniref:Nucleolar protein 11 n=1 Tax=Mycena pura TaxID=153505 RepID=A0AAD6VT23_9AGAR|nr:hypothetical protein GGX14DRAFT_670888 [Mycena pura]